MHKILKPLKPRTILRVTCTDEITVNFIVADLTFRHGSTQAEGDGFHHRGRVDLDFDQVSKLRPWNYKNIPPALKFYKIKWTFNTPTRTLPVLLKTSALFRSDCSIKAKWWVLCLKGGVRNHNYFNTTVFIQFL